jgi:SAM-dependent methyltransferase
MITYNLPFYIGSSSSCHNPENIPDVFPIDIYYDESYGIIRQKPNALLLRVLNEVYTRGLLIGTPLGEDELALPYTEDFLAFINRVSVPDKKLKILEVGAGTGYLSRRLIDMGHEVTCIEPGNGYSEYWKKYDISVINDFFPSPLCSGPYDLIVSYLVLEHIPDPVNFISDMKSSLAQNGSIIFAVPDESQEIEAGDPSMLIHEHFNYFDSEGLNAVLSIAGLSSVIERSRYGRCLYSCSVIDEKVETDKFDHKGKRAYFSKVKTYKNKFQQEIQALMDSGTVGIFCPGRALSLIEVNMDVRMFDDDPYLLNKYYPPFISKIENRSSLIENPVDNLVIMSRTFGSDIKRSLIHDGYRGQIFLSTELI